MDEDSGIQEAVDAAVGKDERIEYLEDGVGPNFRVAIAPNGYIWFSLGVDLISTQGYCDGNVARAMAKMLEQAAKEHDRIMVELQAQELLKDATNVVDLSAVRQAKGLTDSDEEAALAVANDHEIAVDDATEAEARDFN